jgi:hypothetical protein
MMLASHLGTSQLGLHRRVISLNLLLLEKGILKN